MFDFNPYFAVSSGSAPERSSVKISAAFAKRLLTSALTTILICPSVRLNLSRPRRASKEAMTGKERWFHRAL